MRWLGTAVAVAAMVAARTVGAVGGPELDYTLECQGCHRADGSGTPGTVPELAGSVAKFLRVPGGREYLARVPGVAQAPLDDAQLAAVINWMLDRFDRADVPAGFVPYTAEEIEHLRRSPLTDVDRVRKNLVDAIARQP